MSSALNVTTNSALVSNGVVAASSVTSIISTNSALVSNGVVAASSVSAASNGTSSASNGTTAASSSANAANAGLIANPVSWKYGIAMIGVIAGSLVFGAGI